MADLSRLSANERQALLLLSQGHTAKSAALQLNTTAAGINERLREARRKTGVGSSRELARMLGAAQAGSQGSETQEIRDEQLGMAAAPVPIETAGRKDGRRLRWPMVIGASLMIALASAAGAFAALILAQNPGAPHVVSTYPADGARVPAGEITLSVTFDRPMRPDSYSFVRRSADTFPECLGKSQVSDDHKTFRVTCTVQAGRNYEVGFNDMHYRNFVSETDGAAATPAVLHFTAR